MTILILEDEPLIAKGLMLLIRQLEPNAQLEGPLQSVRDTIQWIEGHPAPDLVLADIQLSDGISFQALEKLNPQTPVIFTTAFDEYALRAFRVNSIDYLLKPIDELDLKRSLEKFHLLQVKFNNAEFQKQLQDVLLGKQIRTEFKKRFLVYSGKSIIPVITEEIAFFQKEEIIFLNTLGAKQYVTEFRSLDEIQELLDPTKFYRVNRQFLVQGNCIRKFETDYMGKITVHLEYPTPMQLQISKDKAADFRKWMEER